MNVPHIKDAERMTPPKAGWGVRVLIVEDEPGILEILARMLERVGYDVTCAEDGEHALEIIEDEKLPFRVVVACVFMPELGGPEVIRRAADRLAGAKIVFMSGYDEAAVRDRFEDIAGARYLRMPFTVQRLAQTMEDALAA